MKICQRRLAESLPGRPPYHAEQTLLPASPAVPRRADPAATAGIFIRTRNKATESLLSRLIALQGILVRPLWNRKEGYSS